MSRTTDAEEIKRIKDTLESLIVWIAQAANNPISHNEASVLLTRLAGGRRE